MSDYPPGMKLRPINQWPGAFTRDRQVASFSADHSSTLKLLDRELRLLDPKDTRYPVTILQIALRERDFRNDGMPRAQAKPDHPGIILSIEPRNRPRMTFPCDTFTRWQDNLRGIALGMEKLRALERYGIVRGDQQYRGWQAIEAAPSVDVRGAACALLARVAWSDETDGYQAKWAPKITTNPDIGRRTYRKALANAHPDRNGGEQSLYDEVQQAGRVLGLSSAIASR